MISETDIRSDVATPRNEVLIALDLETTGLDPSHDRIIDVGACKFRGDENLGSYASLVNPRRKISSFITALTGIEQRDVDSAPGWEVVSSELEEFIGEHRLVGHNIGFDVGFLKAQGIATSLSPYDTVDMARVALPRSPEFGLERLSERFGIVHDAPHRAFSDALASRDLFLLLLKMFEDMDRRVLTRMHTLSNSPRWLIGGLASGVAAGKISAPGGSSISPDALTPQSLAGRLSLDYPTHLEDEGPAVASALSDAETETFVNDVGAAFESGGLLSKHFGSYESRSGQKQMAERLARAMAKREKVIVEAGTGIGKTIAYLLPAALHAARHGVKVVISTNTINLQEQILKKDFELVRSILNAEIDADLNAAQLKGRSNYLCYTRWRDAVSHSNHSPIEARVLAQCMTWLNNTESGDSAELSLGRDAPVFSRYSAEGCPPSRDRSGRFHPCQGPPCFMLKARSEALTADILIINHSLLILDRVNGGRILPEPDVLIVDEAHHLQATATHMMGFWIRESLLMEDLKGLTGESALVHRLAQLAISMDDETHALNPFPQAQENVIEAAGKAMRIGSRLFNAIRGITLQSVHREGTRELRVLGKTRQLKEWRDVAGEWTQFGQELDKVRANLSLLLDAADPEDSSDATIINANSVLENITKTYDGLAQLIDRPDENYVYWTSVDTRRDNSDVILQGAPLDVGEALRTFVFNGNSSYILTGASISEHGDFQRFKSTIGFEDSADDLSIDSPFNFNEAALILVPEDIPDPNGPGYAAMVTDALYDVAVASGGRSLALFTSNSALNNAREELLQRLKRTEVRLFAQGRDGPPARVMRLLNDSDRALALGSMSLWEGVDLEDASINALVMTRLPFPMPFDPIHAARSERFEDGFNDYSVPEAVMKFRQGFGRLIRSHRDRGVFVVLDRRIISRRYGREFQRSIPNCTVRRVTLARIGEYIDKWHRREPV